MASTKASRKAKREGSRKDNGSDNGSVMKTRKAHHSKDLLTKDAVKKATARAKETRDTISKTRSLRGKPIAQNGRQPGRQLIRWNASTDQILLLIMEYELKKHGLAIPYDAIAKRLASEKDTTGACVQQHLAKLRKEMLARGCWVPPLAGKPSARQESSDVRGLVMVPGKGGHELKEVGWNEDAFKYVDVVHINQTKMGKEKKKYDVNESTGLATGLAKMKRSPSSVPGGDDPADLPSEDEFNPTNNKPNQFKRITRSSAKSAGRFNQKFDEFESGTDNESNSDGIDKDGGPPVMMALYESEEEEEEVDGNVILNLPVHIAAQFPPGVNGNAPAIHVGDTNTEGESVSYDDDTESGSFSEANGTPNSSAAMMEDQDDSIMDANTFENYLAAFPGMFDSEYSVMDANTQDNYMAAFGDGIGHGVHDYNTSSNFQDINTSPESDHVVGYSGPAPADDMFGPSLHGVSSTNNNANVEGTWPPEVQQLYRNFVARTAHPTATDQNAVGSSNTGRHLFPSGTRVRDIFNGGPTNRETTGNSAGNNVGFGQASSLNDSFDGNTRYGFGEGSGDMANNNISSIDPVAMAEEDLVDLDGVGGLMEYAPYDEEPDFGSLEYATFRDEYDYGPLFESEY